MLQPFTVEQFGGLNTRDDPFEVGLSNATAMSNVDLDHVGRVRTRDGFQRIDHADDVSGAGMCFFEGYTSDGYLLVGDADGDLIAVGVGGTISGDVFPLLTGERPSSNNGYARIGQPGTATLYIGGAGVTGLHTMDAAGTISAVGGSPPTGDVLAASPIDNRLVVAGGDRVNFSSVSNPSTFGSTDFVDVSPGDGETIVAAVAWRSYLFVFKQTKFFVFYGTSVDADGGAIFNYNTVNTGQGVGWMGAAVAGDEGVYFANEEGLFRTAGDAPVRVSDAVEGAWSIASQPAIAYYRGRVYVVVLGTGLEFVYDARRNTWLQWSVGLDGVCTVPDSANDSSTPGGIYGALGKAVRLAPGATTDGGTTGSNGTAISWSYTSGRYALADPGRVTITPDTSVHGSGTVTLRLDSDLYSNQTGSVTLGTAPAVAEGWPAAVDQEGAWMQHTLSGSGPASVSRLTHYLSFVKPAGVR